MSTKHLLDPHLVKAIDVMPSFTMSAETVVRDGIAQTTILGDATARGMSREEVYMPSANGPDVRALLYQPVQSKPSDH